MSEAQIQKFIFAPGFSTAQTITSVSGRGVGMDVVRNNIDQIGGSIDVQSVQGKGLSFTIKIPLTLAIVSALIVESGGERFAIPQLSVVELVRVHAKSEHRIERIKDAAVLRLRNKLLPLVRLSSLLKLDGDAAIPEKGFIVVTQVGAQIFGVVVDGVFHTEEIVVKPMASQAPPHRHVLRQHHPRRRLGDHDRRSERRGAGDRQLSPPPRPRIRDTDAERACRRREHRRRCSCSAPARRSPRRCRCRWSRGSKRSTARRSSCRTAATWCSTAAI